MMDWLEDNWPYATIGVLFLCATCTFYWFLPLQHPYSFLSLRDYRVGVLNQVCEQTVGDYIQIRASYRVYARGNDVSGRPIDPDNPTHDLLSHDYYPNYLLFIPYIYYEISHDSGISWQTFWAYPSGDYQERGAICKEIGAFDDQHFWVWALRGIAVTHDGGQNWFIHHEVPHSSAYETVEFTGPMHGRITFPRGRNLITTDGGATWHEESAS
jgi:photosystem II stability/assembly factor-like uncharacterized protein